MASKIELTASQAASLDLLIAQKKADPGLTSDWADAVNNLGNSVVAAVGVAAVTLAAVAAHTILDHSIRQSLSAARNCSLDDLLAIRKNAIVKG